MNFFFSHSSDIDLTFEMVEYSIDALSLMNYYVKAGIFSLAALEKITGINQKQLWAYTSGTRPRKAQAEKILSGFHRVAKDLESVFVGL